MRAPHLLRRHELREFEGVADRPLALAGDARAAAVTEVQSFGAPVSSWLRLEGEVLEDVELELHGGSFHGASGVWVAEVSGSRGRAGPTRSRGPTRGGLLGRRDVAQEGDVAPHPRIASWSRTSDRLHPRRLARPPRGGAGPRLRAGVEAARGSGAPAAVLVEARHGRGHDCAARRRGLRRVLGVAREEPREEDGVVLAPLATTWGRRRGAAGRSGSA